MHNPSHLLVRASLFCWVLSVALAIQVKAAAQRPDADFERIRVSLLRNADAALSQEPTGAGVGAQPGFAANAEAPAHPSGLQSESNANRQQRFASAVLSILQKRSLPTGLSAVIEVESGQNPLALSRKGARGLWQLMPDTARRYGLEVDAVRDERIDIARSTEAAAQYLADLYARFGSWPLALAAYNWGEGNLAYVISRKHSSDFSLLADSGALPLETRNFVPAVLAKWPPYQSIPRPQTADTGTLVYANILPPQSVLPLAAGPVLEPGQNERNTFNQPQKEISK